MARRIRESKIVVHPPDIVVVTGPPTPSEFPGKPRKKTKPWMERFGPIMVTDALLYLENNAPFVVEFENAFRDLANEMYVKRRDVGMIRFCTLQDPSNANISVSPNSRRNI